MIWNDGLWLQAFKFRNSNTCQKVTLYFSRTRSYGLRLPQQFGLFWVYESIGGFHDWTPGAQKPLTTFISAPGIIQRSINSITIILYPETSLRTVETTYMKIGPVNLQKGILELSFTALIANVPQVLTDGRIHRYSLMPAITLKGNPLSYTRFRYIPCTDNI